MIPKKKDIGVSWESIYRQWEFYADLYRLNHPLQIQKEEQIILNGFDCKQSFSLAMIDLFVEVGEDKERQAAIWIASFCHDLLYAYSYLLRGNSYLVIDQVYHVAMKSLGLSGWDHQIRSLLPQLIYSQNLLEGIESIQPQQLVEMAMIQASWTVGYYHTTLACSTRN